jgi:8-oxo-dGTP pyrophosphatase MutT (NUDIX family)
MKKIFIGNNIVFLSSVKDAKAVTIEDRKIHRMDLLLPFISKKDLLGKVTSIEQSVVEEVILFIHDPVKELERAFFSLYKPVEAAGGAVFNDEERLLMIFRRGKWDLPKGKADQKETMKKAARREISEETGIGQLKITSQIKFLNGKQDCTYHTYNQNGKRILKSTHWYIFSSNDKRTLIPQQEEGIEKVAWCSKRQVQEHLTNSYHSIEEVVREAMKGSK